MKPKVDRTTDDAISRRAAIYALNMIGSVDTDADREYAMKVFMSLPSVQPQMEAIEVVRCAHCRNWYAYADEQFGYCRRECWEDDGQYRLNVETNHDDYCSYGERRDG